MTRSLWKAKGKKANFPVLKGEVETDIAIVGGGITGITSAYLLAKSGKKVVVLESREISGSTTGDSTGNLYAMVDKRLHHVQSKWDKDTAGIVARSRTEAVNLVESLAKEHNIDCNFKRVPWILFNETDEKDTTIEKERAAAADYGLKVETIAQLPIPIHVHSAIKVENQAQFNPSAFVNGLAEKIDPAYGSIYENSPVQDIQKGEKHVLTTPLGKVTANKVIMATHTPKGVYGLHTVVAPYREYAIAAKLRTGEFPEGIYWDTDAEHHNSLRSYKTDKDNYVLVVGGHHKVGQAADHEMHYKKLEDNARKYFDVEEVEYRWSAQHYKPSDGLPYIGETHDDNIFVATGFSTDGLTYGVLSAMIFDDLFNGRENKWAKTYEAKRFTPVKSAKEFIKENVNVMKEYTRNLPGQADAESFSEVKIGEGKVVESDDGKLAVYKDEVGKVHCVSAVCTHLYCIVDWNDAEKSWDCPCHGSRFEVDGGVIEGPALAPLSKKDVKQSKS